MIRFEKRFFVNLSPQEVFNYMTDPARSAEWQEGIVSAAWTSPGPPQAGSTIQATASLLGRRVEVETVITAWDPPYRYKLETTRGPAPLEMQHDLAAQADGTLVTVRGQVELGGLVERLVGRQIEKRVEEDARRIKARLQAD